MNMPMGGSKISEMIANLRAGLDELEATVAGEEQQPEEPIEGEEPTEETMPKDLPTPEMQMKKKSSALDRFAGM